MATSSLELGIDMALVDLVIQVEAPSSVPSGLQPIAEGWDEAAAAARLASDPERAVGEALLDQQVIAGWATSTVRDLLSVRTQPVARGGGSARFAPGDGAGHRLIIINRSRRPPHHR